MNELDNQQCDCSECQAWTKLHEALDELDLSDTSVLFLPRRVMAAAAICAAWGAADIVYAVIRWML